MESCKNFVLWTSAAIAGAIVLAIGASAHIEPFWILASAAGIPGIVLAMRRVPAAFIPVLIFVSALKTRPSAGFTPGSVLTDPTFIAIVLLYGTNEKEQGIVTIKDMTVGREKAKAVGDRKEWLAARPGQTTAKRAELVAAVRKLLAEMG